MQAFLRTHYGAPDILELRDVEVPTPGGDQILVRVVATSINMADVDYLLGRPGMARLGTGLRAPRNKTLGLDVAGVVEVVGPDVSRFSVGDEVFGDLTNHGFGAFAEYVCAPEAAFAPKPAPLTFAEAAAVPQAGVMALQGLRGKRPVQAGQHVLVNGAGGNIGPFAVQIAKAFGAEVTGVDNGDKLEMVSAMGADHVIDYTQQDYTTMGIKYDRILDMAAFHSILATRQTLNAGGVYVMVPGTLLQMVRLAATPILSLLGSRKLGMLPWRPMSPQDVAILTGLIDSGKVRPHIDRTYSFAEIPAALEYQRQGRARGKLVVEVAA